ncbi:MAG TPA: Rrf2 family transcriptional regulator [Solirubrobacterales bacterium]
MRVSAKVDYAVRAAVELARADGRRLRGEEIAAAQGIPFSFLENILVEMRHAGLVRSRRGAEGGYWLARPPEDISVADVFRAVEGPLAWVADRRPEDVDTQEGDEAMRDLWIALRTGMRQVLEPVSLRDLSTGKLPRSVAKLTEGPEDWVGR